MNIFVTGVRGFIGRELAKELVTRPGFGVTGSIRSHNLDFQSVVPVVSVGDIDGSTDWRDGMQGKDVVVHLAGRAHVLNEKKSSPINEFRKVNVEGTVSLAKQAMKAGVKRFVFISSIGVNGSFTTGTPFSECSKPAPHVSYALSKHEAELALQDLLKDSTMELVIIRPPLVYAAHAPGNFAKLMKLVSSGVPLPFGLVNNQRSMVALENLVDFIAHCVEHPSAANQTFLISDGVDVSTPEIIRCLADGMGAKARLLPVPVGLLRLGAVALNRRGLFEQLCGSLVIDSTKARDLLGWRPPVKPDDALINAGRSYIQSR